MTISRMDERQAIKAAREREDAARRAVNERPDVIAARAAVDEARDALARANMTFRAVFDAAWKGHEQSPATTRRQHPGVVVMGIAEDEPWLPFCAATGLPFFDGDHVVIIDEDSHQLVLADAVLPELCGPVFMIGQNGETAAIE